MAIPLLSAAMAAVTLLLTILSFVHAGHMATAMAYGALEATKSPTAVTA